MKRIIVALALVTSLAAFTGIVLKFNSSYARAEVVYAVSARVDTHILEDELRAITEKMWKIEDRWTEAFIERYNRYPESIVELLASMPQERREDYRDLEKRRAVVEAKLKKLRGE